MRHLSKAPHHLVRNPYSYCFRVNVPNDLRRFVGKKELRYSLKTGYLGVAREKAQIIAGQVQQIFSYLRKGGIELSSLSDEKIQELVQQYLKEYIENLETRYHDEPDHFVDRLEFDSYLMELDDIEENIPIYLGIGDYRTVEEIVSDLFKKNGIKGIDKGSTAYIKLCRGVLQAQLKGIEIEKRQMSGDYSGSPYVSFNEQLPVGFQKVKRVEEGQLISEVIEEFAKETEKNWQPKTKNENLAILKLFKEVVGDVPIQSITRKTVGEFKQTLKKLPPNLRKNPKYRKKSISEIAKMEVPKTMSDTTISKYLTRVGALFDYARKNGIYEGANPATGMNPPKDRREHEATAPFVKDDLIKLFHSEDYLEDTHDKSFKFWMPILALFTGMRLNEIAQLHLSDIRQVEDGVWVLDINDEKEKRLKTKSILSLTYLHL